ncbi:MAG: GAF domain-containing protein [Anaerolineae bacterium]|nr:GAF domain-containing protein [Anaerolineae bacterium]
MFKRIGQFLAPPVFEGDEDKTQAANLANTIVLATIVTITLASVLVVVTLRNYLLMGLVFVSMTLPLTIALLMMRRGYVRAAALLTTIMLWLVLVVMGFFIGGVINTSFIAITLVIIIAALLLGGRAAVIFTGMSIVAVTLTFVSEVVGVLPPPLAPNQPVNYWVVYVVTYAIAATLLYLAMRNLTESIQRARRLTAESEAQRGQLQTLVRERTQDLERNASYLRATTAIARESAAAEGDPQTLLAHAVDVIGTQFGHYHVGIYVLDALNEWAELRAVFGQGQQLLARGFRLRVDIEGMIGDVARRGVYRLARDVSQDFAYVYVDDMPDTRSELVIPLKTGDQVAGVLDVQSAQVDAFTDQDVQVLQALADQVAIALSNAQLLEQVRQAIAAERQMYGAQTGEAWQRLTGARQALGFYSTEQATILAGDLWQPEMKAALQTGGTIQDTHDARRLAVPVKVRNEVIGVIDFAKPGEGSVWTAEEITLVESLTEQLGVALESARLYQDTQRTAARERVIGEVSGRIRETLDMETMLRTAAEQMRQALDLEDLVVRLASPDAKH